MFFIKELIARLSTALRESKISLLQDYLEPPSLILDIGVWCAMPEPNASENWLEKRYGADSCIVALGLNNMREFHLRYPKVLCVQGDGSALPFSASAFRAAFSNAVLEHVPAGRQASFVQEIVRVVSRKAVLAVPDRLCPIEIHSRIFFLHWLPMWRSLFRRMGEKFWSSERNLTTIFSRRALQQLLQENAGGSRWKIRRQFLFFIPVSLLAILEKDGTT